MPPTRGIIYDRNGLVIADNQPDWQLVAVPEEVGDLEATLIALEKLELVDPSEHNTLVDLVRSHRGFERVKISSSTEEQAARFAVRRHHFPGVDIQEVLTRSYPFGEASAHAVGYVGSISTADLERIERSEYAATQHIGKSGVERAYEDILHGRVGYRQQVVNAQGRVLFDPAAGGPDGSAGVAGVETKWPTPGENLVLSLDMRLQLATQQAMQEVRGAAVVIDPSNGDVLALVSTPSFDPNRFATGLSRADFVALNTDPDKPLLNRALAGRYPPGSTMKPFLALAALQHEASIPARRCSARDTSGCRGKRTATATGGRRATARSTCTTRSCSPATSTSTTSPRARHRQHGARACRRSDSARRPASTSAARTMGVVPSREWKEQQFARREDQVWFPGETVITGIGQGFTLVTPVQLAHAGAVLAARGKSFKPRLLIGTEDALTRETTWTEPQALPAIDDVDPAHWEPCTTRWSASTKDAARLRPCIDGRRGVQGRGENRDGAGRSTSRKTKATTRRRSTSGCATTACSWPTHRSKRRGSRLGWSSRTAAAAAALRLP